MMKLRYCYPLFLFLLIVLYSVNLFGNPLQIDDMIQGVAGLTSTQQASLKSALTDEMKTLEILLDHADRALYQAKKAGRNKVVRYEGSSDEDGA